MFSEAVANMLVIRRRHNTAKASLLTQYFPASY